MPKGKPFVCWLGNVALCIGDIVELQLDSGEWIRGKFGCYRNNGIFPYFVKCGKVRHQAASIHELRPVKKE